MWKSTEHLENDDFKLILEKTAFKMLGFVNIKNPLIRNYFKDWLIDSQKNFSIILNNVLKDIIDYTNWSLEEENLYYNIDFDCDKFLNSLNNLLIIYEYGKTNFYHYMKNCSIPVEFQVFEQ